MVKKFVLFVVLLVVGTIQFRNAMYNGRLVAFLDKAPDRKGTATVLYGMGCYFEIFNENRRAFEAYKRIMDRYPKCRYAEGAQFGKGLMLERLGDFPGAVVEYRKFVELFPKSKKAISVQNNIYLLGGR